MLLDVTGYLAIIVPILVNVAFLTLMERKILGLSQLRKGPNKTSLVGLLQPIADAVKLFLKESTILFKGNQAVFTLRPAIALFIALWL